MRYVESGQPLYEGFISGKPKDQNRNVLVFVDDFNDKWFQMEPGRFAFSLGQTLASTKSLVGLRGLDAVAATLPDLFQEYPKGWLRMYDPEQDD